MQKNESKKQPKKRASKRLGDKIEDITKATGIKKAVELFSKATGIDCGCEERKEKLNQLFKGKTPLCLVKEEYDTLTPIINKNRINRDEQIAINTIFERIFDIRAEQTSCAPCLRARVEKLKLVYNTYDNDSI